MNTIRKVVETILLWPHLNTDSAFKAQHGCIVCLALMICVELQAEELGIFIILTIGRVGLGSELIIESPKCVERSVIADGLSTMYVQLLWLAGVFGA